jgi:hypothetical protein
LAGELFADEPLVAELLAEDELVEELVEELDEELPESELPVAEPAEESLVAGLVSVDSLAPFAPFAPGAASVPPEPVRESVR